MDKYFSIFWLSFAISTTCLSKEPSCQRILLTKPQSTILAEHRFSSLDHFTDVKNLISIIKDYELRPAEDITTEFTPGFGYLTSTKSVFFQLSTNKEPSSLASRPQVKKDKIILIFNLTLLDSKKFHISGSQWWAMGRFAKETDYTSDHPNLLETFLRSSTPNEVVLYSPVSLKYLMAIYVTPMIYDKTLTTLKAQGVHQIANRPIEEVILPLL